MRTGVQKLGKSLMTPLSIIVAAGLLLGLVSILQNPSIVGEGFVSLTYIQNFVGLVQSIVGALFGLLPILFAISVAIGMSRDDKEIAAFAAVIGFILFHITISYFLKLYNITAETMNVDYLMKEGLSQLDAVKTSTTYDTVFGIFSYRMSIFGGIIVGLWVAMVHNRFHQTQLPAALSFFSGKRFVPIMTTVTIPLLAAAMYFVWPILGSGINQVGNFIGHAGAFGAFVYGFLERLLIPTGLHHILNQLVRFTPIGGTAIIEGESVSGALTIFNSLLAQPNPDLETMQEATKFLSQGTHAFMVFGLPAACLAMYRTAKPEQKKKVKGIFMAAAVTSFLTGITEPIEFAFIFISPILFIFHAFMAGLSFMLNDLFHVMIGNAQGGVFDLLIFGVFRGLQTKWYITVAIGLSYSVIYYFVFKFIITKFNVKTPGRDIEVNDDVEAEVEASEKTGSELALTIIQALGGSGNIQEVDNCISRLRLILRDTSIVQDKILKENGALGIIKIDKQNIQVVYGPKVEQIARIVKNNLNKDIRKID
jgi:maltose/glucose PTS system EIICB component